MTAGSGRWCYPGHPLPLSCEAELESWRYPILETSYSEAALMLWSVDWLLLSFQVEYKESTVVVELLLSGYVFITQAPNVRPTLLHHRLRGHAVAVLSLRLFSHLQWPFLICLCYAALRECEELSNVVILKRWNWRAFVVDWVMFPTRSLCVQDLGLLLLLPAQTDKRYQREGGLNIRSLFSEF